MNKYYPPSFKVNAFCCPHCGVYAKQNWHTVFEDSVGRFGEEYFCITRCDLCNNFSIWIDEKIIYPSSSSAPLPSEDMPEVVRFDFIEARNIVNLSPRAACALLRLSIQKLAIYLGEKGENLNDDIGSLVKKGLPVKIQKALDSVRVIGNNAVHPGELDLKDDVDTAVSLFELINMIVDVMISQPKKVDVLFSKIPTEAIRAIEKRDKSSN